MALVSSWGRLGHWEHEVLALTDREQAGGQISLRRPGLAYGLGRSYGDVCLNPGGWLWRTAALDRFISFDPNTGILVCEAGVLLRDIQRLFIPRSWMLPVTPGTLLVTVGGAIANDVHGKNHHVRGTFGEYVRRLTLVRTDGEIIECGPDLKADWFAATVGGLGLTGLILTAELQLHPTTGPWIDCETIPYYSLSDFFDLSSASEAGWEYTMSWFDCLRGDSGRGIFFRGNPAEAGTRPEPKTRERAVPLTPPCSLVNRLTLRLFNDLYFNVNKRRNRRGLVHYQPFFYPLDHLQEWNRIYGPRGFFQYQSVVPPEHSREAVQAMLGEISSSGEGSFLAVLKSFGDRPPAGMLSFPRAGVTLALDFPNRGEGTLKLFQRLDAIVAQAGGRLYPAKDARMPPALFRQGYPRLGEFSSYRDPGISSALARRLMES
ncbi:FAD-binding oxidoreductase [Desulfoferula mesophila]